jgi:hypothetical protein
MSFETSPSIDYTLTNVPPVIGEPRNTVNVTCSAPAGSGSSNDTMVTMMQ